MPGQAQINKTMIDPQTVADMLSVSTRTLRKWRDRGDGPKFFSMNNSQRPTIRYSSNDVEEWLENQKSL